MSKIRVFCDLDQTLCDLVMAVILEINKKYKTFLSHRDILHYQWLTENIGPEVNKIWSTPSIYDSVEIFPFAKKFVEVCKERYDFHIMTYCEGDMAKRKKAFIQENFGLHDDNIWTVNIEKHVFMGPKDILVDDYLRNLQGHIHHNGGYGILFNFREQHPASVYSPKSLITDKHLYATDYTTVIKYLDWAVEKLKGE